MAYFYTKRIKAPLIQRILIKEGIVVSRQGINQLFRRYKEFGCFNRVLGSRRPFMVMAHVKGIRGELNEVRQ